MLAAALPRAQAPDLHLQLAQIRARGQIALVQAAGDATAQVRALVVASHPDDRWVLPAAYFRFHHHWQVVVLLLTRGEGGQNITGPETGDRLGRIRTLEAELAGARLDVELRYLNRQDAGFCRTAQEALELWGTSRTVADLARVLREVRPHLILTTHHPAETHGHDLALLRLLPEAVALATSAEAAISGKPLAPPRVFAGAAPDQPGIAKLDFDEVEPVRGETIRRLAYEAHLEHRSQWPIAPLEELFERELRLVRIGTNSSTSDDPLFTGWPDLASTLPADAPVARDLAQRLLALPVHVADPGGVARRALALRHELLALPVPEDPDQALAAAWRLDALERIVRHGAALTLRVEPQAGAAVPGERLRLRVYIDLGGGLALDELTLSAVSGGELRILEPAEQPPFRLPPHGKLVVDAELTVAADLPSGGEQVRRLYREPRFRWPVELELAATIEGQRLRYRLPVGVDVLPPVGLEVTPGALLLPRGDDDVRFAVAVQRHVARPVDGELRVLAPAGFLVVPASVPISMALERATMVPFELRTPPGLRPGVYTIVVELAGTRLALPLHKVDVELGAGLRVGLIKGVDDTAGDVLAGLGAEVVPLRDEDLSLRPLDEFDAIVCDVRSLRLREVARAAFPRLLSFVAAGGRLVVFYHKDVEFNPEAAGFRGAPYDLRVGKGRVTRADAPVRVLLPEHLLLRSPNRIAAEDWDGWQQERGLYFPDRYAPKFEELLELSDPGQPPERGALLYARYGDGEYVYCALSLWRQLKNLHPGACRLFANLVQRPR